MGGMDEITPKQRNPQLLLVPVFFHFDVRVDFTSVRQVLFVGLTAFVLRLRGRSSLRQFPSGSGRRPGYYLCITTYRDEMNQRWTGAAYRPSVLLTIVR